MSDRLDTMVRKESRRRVRRVLRNLLSTWPFFGTLALRLPIQEDATRKTIASDGRRLLYNPQWVGEVDDDTIRADIAGLVLACGLKHHTRRGDRDYGKWQWASQEVRLPFLREAGLTDRAGGLDTSIEKAYRQAPDMEDGDEPNPEQPPMPDATGDAGSGSGTGSPGEGNDDQESPDTPQDGKRPPPSSDPSGQGEIMDSPAGKKGGDGEGDGNGSGSGDDDGIPDSTETPRNGGPDAERKAEEQDWDKALEQAQQLQRSQKAQGTMPGSLEQLIGEMHRSRLDWQTILRRFMDSSAKVNRSWMRPNRRYVWQGTYLPSRYGRSMGELVFAVDTSGSMDEEELAMVWSEIRSAADELNPDAVVVIQCDARVNAIDEYQPGNLPHQIVVKGRGGTDFRPVFRAMEDRRKPACLIYMTDLMGDFPADDPGWPVIWIDTVSPEYSGYRSSGYQPPFGEVIKLKEGERVAGS